MLDLYIEPYTRMRPSLYAPSARLSKLACGWYGVGHTAWRQPGNTTRGTVVGKKGRFRRSCRREEVMSRT